MIATDCLQSAIAISSSSNAAAALYALMSEQEAKRQRQ